jgi:hypothetical protein
VSKRREDAMELRLTTFTEVPCRAERDAADGSQENYRRKPQHAIDAASQSGAVVARENAQPRSPGDWSGTLDLVLRASEKLVVSDERVRDLETEVRELSDAAALEIQQLRAQLADLQGQLTEAEAGRRHAVDWLRRLSDAVRDRLSPEAVQDREAPAVQAS